MQMLETVDIKIEVLGVEGNFLKAAEHLDKLAFATKLYADRQSASSLLKIRYEYYWQNTDVLLCQYADDFLPNQCEDMKLLFICRISNELKRLKGIHTPLEILLPFLEREINATRAYNTFKTN